MADFVLDTSGFLGNYVPENNYFVLEYYAPEHNYSDPEDNYSVPESPFDYDILVDYNPHSSIH